MQFLRGCYFGNSAVQSIRFETNKHLPQIKTNQNMSENTNETNEESKPSTHPMLGQLTYRPEIWQVEKDTIYSAIHAVECGLEYANECLAQHEATLGRTTMKNRTWAETMDAHIRCMQVTLKMLRDCRLLSKKSEALETYFPN